jgi:glycosyltransferase involved in cell wall biosynthesis
MKTKKEKKLKIAIIGTVGVPAKYGGFETLAEHLVDNLNSEYDITVYCSKKKYNENERTSTYKNVKLKFLPLNANGVQSIPYDTISIIHSLFYADVLLILGVAGAWILPFVRLFTKKKIVVSIDGIEWKRDKWNRIARWYLFWAENIAVKYSHIDISDNEAIQDYTAIRYGTLSRIIEYGADHTLKVFPSESDLVEYPILNENYAIKVCRIEPENNVHEVIEAFLELPNHKLVMIGNWDNSDYGLLCKEKAKDAQNIILFDPIYNQYKLDLLRSNAKLYIHGHSAGGTNPSLVEAMYLGLPIFAFSVSYNRKTTENKAKYFKNQFDLIELIINTNQDEISSMALQMESIAHRRYVWKKITHKYKLLIEEAFASKGKSKIYAKTQSVDESKLIDMNIAHLKHHKSFFEK